MSFWKYIELFEEHKFFHNAQVGKLLYNIEDKPKEKEEEVQSSVCFF